MAEMAATAPASPPDQPPRDLDEVMLAMDVVDTLRHAETLVEGPAHGRFGQPGQRRSGVAAPRQVRIEGHGSEAGDLQRRRLG